MSRGPNRASEPTLLVADDDVDLLETYEIWLRNCEWEIRTAVDGTEAVAALDGSLDAMVCDRRMPGYRASDIRERIENADFELPMVVISAYEPDAHLAETDVQAYLTKPIGRDDLVSAVESVLKEPASHD